MICKAIVKEKEQALECPICKFWVHRKHKELGITQKEYWDSIKGKPAPNIDTWKCSSCTDAGYEEEMELSQPEDVCIILQLLYI